MLTLYDYSRAPSPRRARILLAEKGIVHATVSVDMMVAEQMGDAYRAVNPALTIPALVLGDGQVLTDNAGIIAWAEATYPEPPLLGTTALEKAEIASWNARIEGEGLLPIAEALRNSSPAMKDRALPGLHNYAQIPELAARGMARLAVFFDMFNAHLNGREFVATNRFSLADITAVVAVDFARAVRVTPRDDQQNLLRWRAQMAERRSMSL